MCKAIKIIVIKLDNRKFSAQQLQEILTEYGCFIKARIGLSGNSESNCTDDGIIIIEFLDNDNVCNSFLNDISLFENIKFKVVTF